MPWARLDEVPSSYCPMLVVKQRGYIPQKSLNTLHAPLNFIKRVDLLSHCQNQVLNDTNASL